MEAEQQCGDKTHPDVAADQEDHEIDQERVQDMQDEVVDMEDPGIQLKKVVFQSITHKNKRGIAAESRIGTREKAPDIAGGKALHRVILEKQFRIIPIGESILERRVKSDHSDQNDKT
jgi:hypothetical protein